MNVIKQTITKDKMVYCVTIVPYSPEIIKSMKRNGYKVKEETIDESSWKDAFGK